MSWKRFEDAKSMNRSEFIATIRCSPRNSVMRFNRSFQNQVVRMSWADFFIDLAGKRLAFRFVPKPTDIHSLWVTHCGDQPHISIAGLLKAFGIDRKRRWLFRVEIKQDPLERLWWFDVSKLLNGNREPVTNNR